MDHAGAGRGISGCSFHPKVAHFASASPLSVVQIIALGVSYFFAVTALDITTNVGTIDDLTSTARIVLVLPVAILDAVFILWVFTSLSKTLAQLQARRAGAKLDLYRQVMTLSGFVCSVVQVCSGHGLPAELRDTNGICLLMHLVRFRVPIP